MYKRLYSFITQNNIIYPLQFGFQGNHSVEYALISLTETIRNTLDDKNLAVVYFLTYKMLFKQ